MLFVSRMVQGRRKSTVAYKHRVEVKQQQHRPNFLNEAEKALCNYQGNNLYITNDTVDILFPFYVGWRQIRKILYLINVMFLSGIREKLLFFLTHLGHDDT